MIHQNHGNRGRACGRSDLAPPRWKRTGIALPVGFAILMCFPPPDVLAGAWLRPAGEWYLKLSGAYRFTRDEYSSAGDLVPIRGDEPLVSDGSYRDISATLYAEYGVSEHLTLVGSLPYKYLTTAWTEISSGFDVSQDIVASNGGMTDARLGARFPVHAGRSRVAVEANIKFPLGYDATPDINQVPPLGSGRVDADAGLQAGTSFWPVNAYVNAGAGYRIRGGLADEFFFNAEGGGTWRWLFGKLAIDGVLSTEPLQDATISSTLSVVNSDLVNFTGEITAQVSDQWGVSGGWIHALAGGNTVAGTSWMLAAVWVGSQRMK